MLYECYFRIVDRQYHDTYEWTGYFRTIAEIKQFIAENEDAGNSIDMVSPFITEVPEDEVDMDAIHCPRK